MLAPTKADFAERQCPYCSTTIPRPLSRQYVRKTCGAPDCERVHFNTLNKKRNRDRVARALAAGTCTRCGRRKRRPQTKEDKRPPLRCHACSRNQAEYNAAYDKKVKRRKFAEPHVIELAETAYVAPKRRVLLDVPPAAAALEI